MQRVRRGQGLGVEVGSLGVLPEGGQHDRRRAIQEVLEEVRVADREPSLQLGQSPE
jgi:hypothetical protein